jgi:FkbM family methyltransferase
MIFKIYQVIKNRFIKFYYDNQLNFYKIKKINHKNQELKFHIINYLTYYRASTFSDKEPETLDWIESFNENSIFFDIGSNIGLYSIYAAKLKNSKVYCFEPSVFNLELLVQNIHLNNVNDNTVIIPIALNNQNSIESFNLSDLSKGAALSTFGKEYNQYGEKLKIKDYYKTVGMKLDDLILNLNINFPDYVKIDVDGIEHLILSGMQIILEKTKSILIEITDSFAEQSNLCNKILLSKGFKRKIIENGANHRTQNQIWYRG